jgi:phage tail-like protein
MSSRILSFALLCAAALPGRAAAAVTPMEALLAALARNPYRIEVDGVPVAGHPTLEALVDASDVVEYKDGEDGITHTRPGNHKPGKMVIHRDLAARSTFWLWRQATAAGKVDRRSISVIFHNDAGEEAGRLNLYNCWPSQWEAAALNARSSGHAVERLELVWETMEYK